MYNPEEIRALIEQAKTGVVLPEGNVADADEIFGFSYGLNFDSDGYLGEIGPVNEAIANRIAYDEVARTRTMNLQEELAVGIVKIDRSLRGQINTIPTIKKPFKTRNTHEVIAYAKPGLVEREVGSLAVFGFRYHQPRAGAELKKAGFVVATPDMSGVGDFDPNSAQPWTRSPEEWIERERKVISYFAVRNWI